MTHTSTHIGKNVLVTGGSGFIGARLVEMLAKEDNSSVSALVRKTSNTKHIRAKSIPVITADLSRKSQLRSAVRGFDTVINLAHNFKQGKKYNLRCFSNLIEACIEHKVKHFIHVSSIVVYDDWPLKDISEASPCEQSEFEYKDTKMAIERDLHRISKEGAIHCTIIQPTIVYGPFSWLWTDLIVEKLLTGTMVIPDQGQGTCNAVYVDDLVDALILAVKHPGQSGEKFIISGPEGLTWHDYLEGFNELLGKNSIKYVDKTVLKNEDSKLSGSIKNILAYPLQIANWSLVRQFMDIIQQTMGKANIERLRGAIRKLKKAQGPIVYYPGEGELDLYCSSCICNIQKAKKLLGYTPKTDFESGLRKTSDYIRKKLSKENVDIPVAKR